MSQAASARSTSDVVDHHLTAFGEQDIDAFLADYTDESVITTSMGTYRGLEDIKAMAEQMFAEFAQEGVEMVFDTQTVVGEIGYTVWHAETPDNRYEFGSDTFVVRDGVIQSQTLAMMVSPKN